jgi:hypothetical protein
LLAGHSLQGGSANGARLDWLTSTCGLLYLCARWVAVMNFSTPTGLDCWLSWDGLWADWRS